MHTFFQDLRYALRMLRKNSLLTAVIVASLAIGIGANSAIFSVVDALLLRPLPYPHPDRLAAVWLHSPAIGILRDWPSPGQYIDIQNENHSFEQMALAQSRTFVLTGHEQPERLFGVRTQSSLLEMLGAKPLVGRLLLPEEDKPGKPDVAVLSERAWKRLFNSDPAIVGKIIVLNGNPFIVAGVRGDAVGNAYGQDGDLCAFAPGSRCGEKQARRKLQHYGAVKAGCVSTKGPGRY
jgi:hypothetical protein